MWTAAGNTVQEDRFAQLQHRGTETVLDPTFFRMYSSRQGRWKTPDPKAGFISDPQTLNLYAYVTNNPTNLLDPQGDCPEQGYCGRYVDCCDVLGDGFSEHEFTFRLQYVLENGNGHYQRCNNPTGICPVIDASPGEFGGSLPTYAIFKFMTFRFLGDTTCIKIARVRADSCVPDPNP